MRAGERYQRFMERVLHRLPVEDVQADEVWRYVGMKEKARRRQNNPETLGDAYCFKIPSNELLTLRRNSSALRVILRVLS